MSLGQKVSANLPFLRRYARALTGSQNVGDALVRATLEAALVDMDFKRETNPVRIALYQIFQRIWDEQKPADLDVENPIGGRHHDGAQHTRDDDRL